MSPLLAGIIALVVVIGGGTLASLIAPAVIQRIADRRVRKSGPCSTIDPDEYPEFSADSSWLQSLRPEPSSPIPTTRDRVLYEPRHDPKARRRAANKRARAARRVTRARG